MKQPVTITAVSVPTGFQGPGYVKEVVMYSVNGGHPTSLQDVEQNYYPERLLRDLTVGESITGYKRENYPQHN